MAIIPDRAFKPICFNVGQIAVHWSLLENSLNQWVIILFQGAGGKHIEDELPRAYTRKRKFIRRCFRSIPILAPYRDEAIDIIEKSVPISQVRDFVIHGALNAYDEQKAAITFQKFDFKLDQQELNDATYGMDQLLTTGGECRVLAERALSLTGRLIEDRIGQKPPDNAPGAVPK